MYREVWEHCKSSVCSIDFISNAGTKITSFTGFKVKKYLVTDNVIDKFAKPAEILIRFTECGNGENSELGMSYQEFLDSRLTFNDKTNPGFLLFELRQDEFKDIPALNCSKRITHHIGHPIAVLGYQLDQDNLAIKGGIISSLFKTSDGIGTIQIDCTIKQGNAGSPLICGETLEVIGVVGHGLAGIARSYNEMMRIINTNLQVLKEAEGKINMEDLDPIQVLIASQNQIKHLATEYFKTASMRVGYAAELCNLADCCPDAEEDLSSIDTERNPDA